MFFLLQDWYDLLFIVFSNLKFIKKKKFSQFIVFKITIIV